MMINIDIGTLCGLVLLGIEVGLLIGFWLSGVEYRAKSRLRFYDLKLTR